MEFPRDVPDSPERFETSVNDAFRILTATALHDDDPLERKYSVYLLGLTRNPRCIPIFISALRDPEKTVRCQATHSLAMVGKEASGELIGLLKDPDWKVRYRAAEALGLLGDEGAVKPLIAILRDDKDHVRYMAAKSLGMMRSPAAREALQQCLSDGNMYVRSMASSALLNIEK